MIRFLRASPVLLLMALAGCGSAPEPVGYLRLPPVPAAASATGAPLGGTLQIVDFDGGALLRERRVAYVLAQEPVRVRQYESLIWNEAPVRTVPLLLSRHLAAAGVADGVLPPQQRGDAAYRLSAHINRFEVISGQSLTAQVNLDLLLLKGGARTLAHRRLYCASAASADDSAAAIAAAFGQALAQAFDRIAMDLRALDTEGPTPSALPFGSC